MSLFRPEALANKQTTWLGTIVLIRPVSFALLTCGGLAIAAALIAFFGWGEYTKKARVTGQLTPETGVVKLYAREPALVREMRLKEGQQVKAGDVLFVLAPERIAASGTDANTITSAQLLARREVLMSEMTAQGRLQREQAPATTRKIAEVEQQFAQVEAEARTQNARVHLAEAALRRTRELADRGFVSTTQVEQKEAELLNEVARAQTITRNKLSAQRELATLAQEARELPARAIRDRAALDRTLAGLRQETGEHDARREYIVRAPEDGTVTAIQADIGHTVNSNAPLASLVPAGSRLHATLYAPSRAIGFVEAGRDVLLRYQSYPYQKFGQHTGKVISVSKAALSPAEIPVGVAEGAREPMYRITVELDAQSVEAYGKPQNLVAGMQVEADVLLDRRRLIEWVFEPVFSLSKKAQT